MHRCAKTHVKHMQNVRKSSKIYRTIAWHAENAHFHKNPRKTRANRGGDTRTNERTAGQFFSKNTPLRTFPLRACVRACVRASETKRFPGLGSNWDNLLPPTSDTQYNVTHTGGGHGWECLCLSLVSVSVSVSVCVCVCSPWFFATPLCVCYVVLCFFFKHNTT